MRLTSFIIPVSCLVTSCFVYGQACMGYSDILIMIDDSDSTKRNNPNDPDTAIYAPGVREFLVDFITTTDLSTVRIGLQAFSKTSRVVSEFSSDAAALNSALSGFVPEYRGSDLSMGFSNVRTTFESNSRLGVRRFVVVLIDGSSDNAVAAATEAGLIEDAGIDVVVIAFGNSVADTELVSFSKNAGDLFKVGNDTQMLTVQTSISEKACSDPCKAHAGSTGLFEYPGNCARFLHIASATQCFLKHCSWTTMWDNNIKTCTFPRSSSCDPCRGQPNGRTTTYDMYCNAYWKCEGGVSVAKCCGSGYKYIQGQGCVLDGTGSCTTSC